MRQPEAGLRLCSIGHLSEGARKIATAPCARVVEATTLIGDLALAARIADNRAANAQAKPTSYKRDVLRHETELARANAAAARPESK